MRACVWVCVCVCVGVCVRACACVQKKEGVGMLYQERLCFLVLLAVGKRAKKTNTIPKIMGPMGAKTAADVKARIAWASSRLGTSTFKPKAFP